jgi:hypothetical protein
MTFRAAQDHNKATGRDMTFSTASSTQWEDPVAMTWRRSCSLLSLAVVLVSLVMNYIVVKVVLLLLVINYIVDLMMCDVGAV